MTGSRLTPFGPRSRRVPVYVATPERGEGPVAIALHDAWGLTTDILGAADRLAGAGFVAFAPDIFAAYPGHTRMVSDVLRAETRVVGILTDLVDWSLGFSTAAELGVVGFGMGGALALLADRHPAVAAISANYCPVPRRAWEVRAVPVVASFGGDDRILPFGGCKLRRMARSAGVDHDILTYGGAGHSFMTDVPAATSASVAGRLLGLRHHRVAAGDAWDRTVRFLAARMPSAEHAPADAARA